MMLMRMSTAAEPIERTTPREKRLPEEGSVPVQVTVFTTPGTTVSNGATISTPIELLAATNIENDQYAVYPKFRKIQLERLLQDVKEEKNIQQIISLEEKIFIASCQEKYPYVSYRIETQRFIAHMVGIITHDLFENYTQEQLLKLDDDALLQLTGRSYPFLEKVQQRKHNRELLEEASKLQLGDRWLRCRCGSTDVDFQQKQVRSADEGSTTFCICRVCGKQWKEQD